MRTRGETWTRVDARGWRKLVPSPQPVGIVELDVITALVNAGAGVIACGGGGVPVRRRPDGHLQGVEAVVDKDSAAARLALEMRADAAPDPRPMSRAWRSTSASRDASSGG